MRIWHLTILFFSLLISSCGTYYKASKSDSIDYKREIADQLFLDGSYTKANNLYYQIYELAKWKPNLKSTYFNYAKSLEKSEKYELLSPFLNSYNSNYSTSTFIEETLLMAAKAEYKLTDSFSKDQERTYVALEKFNAYLSKFPKGKHHTEAITLRNELKEKIEKKAFESAKLYNTIGEYTRDYNAAIVTLNNFLLDYPGSTYKEEALYYKFDSAYKLAINSVYSKMEERLHQAKNFHKQLINFNAETKYKATVDKMIERINKELKQFSK